MFSVLIEAISSVIIALLKFFTSCNGKTNNKHRHKKGSNTQVAQRPSDNERKTDSGVPHKHRRASITETTTTTTTREFVLSGGSSCDSPPHPNQTK